MEMIAHIMFGIISYIFMPIQLNLTFYLIGSEILDLDHSLGYLYKEIRQKWLPYEKVMSKKQRLFRFPRTPIHSLLGALFITSIIAIITRNFILIYSFFIGTIIHLFIDSLDKRGIKWFWPLKVGHIKGKLPAIIPETGSLSIPKKVNYSINISLFIILIITLLFQ